MAVMRPALIRTLCRLGGDRGIGWQRIHREHRLGRRNVNGEQPLQDGRFEQVVAHQQREPAVAASDSRAASADTPFSRCQSGL